MAIGKYITDFGTTEMPDWLASILFKQRRGWRRKLKQEFDAVVHKKISNTMQEIFLKKYKITNALKCKEMCWKEINNILNEKYSALKIYG